MYESLIKKIFTIKCFLKASNYFYVLKYAGFLATCTALQVQVQTLQVCKRRCNCVHRKEVWQTHSQAQRCEWIGVGEENLQPGQLTFFFPSFRVSQGTSRAWGRWVCLSRLIFREEHFYGPLAFLTGGQCWELSLTRSMHINVLDPCFYLHWPSRHGRCFSLL